ncbi:MAG: helix-turn-helix domain-containing protein [Candidatus Eisenbacteria bacterium]|nr:helix-turn-helix domain-containing protein [Candidatus Eisenbacteria bacterium]
MSSSTHTIIDQLRERLASETARRSLRAVATAADIPVSGLSRWARGEQALGQEALARLAAELRMRMVSARR